MLLRSWLISITVALNLQLAFATEIAVVSWNVEGRGQSDSRVVGKQLRDDFDTIDLFALSETTVDELNQFARTAAEDEVFQYKFVPGTTGGIIRLAIFFNAGKFELVDSFELFDIQEGSAGRAPLVVQLKIKTTSEEFLFVVNHLHRTSAEKRNHQATKLRRWGEQQSLPIIAAGDYNFDVDVDAGFGNQAYINFLADEIFRWIAPERRITTNWFDGNSDGQNDFNSILDFVFAGRGAREWAASSIIVVREGDFPDNAATSDHRPVAAFFDTARPAGSPLPIPPGALPGLAGDRIAASVEGELLAEMPRAVLAPVERIGDVKAMQLRTTPPNLGKQSTRDLESRIERLETRLLELNPVPPKPSTE